MFVPSEYVAVAVFEIAVPAAVSAEAGVPSVKNASAASAGTNAAAASRCVGSFVIVVPSMEVCMLLDADLVCVEPAAVRRERAVRYESDRRIER